MGHRFLGKTRRQRASEFCYDFNEKWRLDCLRLIQLRKDPLDRETGARPNQAVTPGGWYVIPRTARVVLQVSL